MALAMPVPTIYGQAAPRIAPPQPLRSSVELLRAEAACMGITFMPWQDVAATFIEALGPYDRWLYPEILELVARQNGKTEILVPFIGRRLRAGRRIMHTAQNRELPREVFGRVAEHMATKHADELASPPRFANGQEEIRLRNGGRYRIVAPTRGGARGPANDDLIVDEVRELASHDFSAAAEPTLSASPNPQTLYLSNEGDEDSLVLNALRQRADEDPGLAWLEWSAAPERAADDVAGWMESNPSIGHLPGKLEYLSRKFESYRLAGTLAIFETEHLCRSQNTRKVSLVDPGAWALREVAALGEPTGRPFMAVALDPSGRRAAAAESWRQADGQIALRVLYDVPGSPIDTDALGRDLKAETIRRKTAVTGFDPATDAQLARYILRTRPIVKQEFANATARFAELISGAKLVWADAAPVTADLAWATRQAWSDRGAFVAAAASDDHPIPALVAAIRAVWLASEPAKAPAKHAPQAMGF